MKQIIILSLVISFTSACQQKDSQTNPINKEQTKTQNQTNIVKPCTKEAKLCPDGSSVSRNPLKNCDFDSCTKKPSKPNAKICTADVKECPDGSFVSRDHYNNCKFKLCPEID